MFNKIKQTPDRCSGAHQSPINIIHNKNTVDTNDNVRFNYKMPANLEHNQFYYDGEKLSMNINVGDIEYFNTDTDSIDKFESYKIELHLPSEHYITENGLTRRCALEMQIFHKLTSRQAVLIKHGSSPISVKQAVVSMLFTGQETEFGDRFFQGMGISDRNIDGNGELNFPVPGEMLKDLLSAPASYASGFDYVTFQGFMNLIGSSRSMFFYYGSTTAAPCKEEVVWMVYREPRGISNSQLSYLTKILAKADKDGNLKGNNREIKRYDVLKRGFIKYNGNAVRKLGSPNLFKKFLLNKS